MFDSLKQSTLLRYLLFAKPYRLLLAVLVVGGIALALLPLLPPYFVGMLVNTVLEDEETLTFESRQRLLWMLVGGLIGVHVLRGVIQYWRGMAPLKVLQAISFDLRQTMWRHLQRLSLGFHISRPTGSLLSRLVSDINVSQTMVNAS